MRDNRDPLPVGELRTGGHVAQGGEPPQPQWRVWGVMRLQRTGNPRRMGICTLHGHAEHFRNLFCGDVAGAQQDRAHPLLDA